MKTPAAQALILVGGRGTRLGRLTSDMPKPLLSVGGRPFLEYIIEELWRHGFRQVVLLAGFAADRLQKWAQAFGRPGLRIDIVTELNRRVQPAQFCVPLVFWKKSFSC